MLLEFLTSRRLTLLHGLLAVAGLAVYVIASHARHQRRHPSAAIAWVVSLALMPYLALPLYILFGSRKVVRGAPAHSTPALRLLNASPSSALAPRFQHLAAAMGLPHAVSCRQLAVHQDGREALDALRSVIQGAGSTLDVCTFLLGRDTLGREVIDLLVRQSRAGVTVRLLIDGIGVYLGGRPDLKPLSVAGVQVALFVSPFRSPLPGRTNLRNHRKMVIADGQRLWSGGRNLAAEYFVGDPACTPQKMPWIDLSFDFCGDLARQAQQRFDLDWAFATQTRRPAPPLAEFAPPAEADGAQLVASGPDQAEDTLYSLLISSCFTARSRILVVTPYFVPDATLLMALTLAARRGVAVDLVLPRQSNHRLADMARPAALREMSAAGARVWLAEAMIHAKAVVIDGELALAGSANLDERSLFLNYELMIAFFKPADVQRFARWIEQQRAAATPYQAHAPRALHEFGEGLIRWLAFQL
ncbi:MAG: PLDc N-terminal domain-containing protein [Xanthomonadaceae bacterium]|nr:PLDc N-terminal domain-containing protein [Xanthomonadaceae bacterium]